LCVCLWSTCLEFGLNVGNHGSGRGSAATSRWGRKSRGALFMETSNDWSFGPLVTAAYLQLTRVAWDQNGSRSAFLERWGNYEVRLLEILPIPKGGLPLLWIEIHDVDGQTSVDSFGCDDLEAAILAAERASAQARKLAEEKGNTPT